MQRHQHTQALSYVPSEDFSANESVYVKNKRPRVRAAVLHESLCVRCIYKLYTFCLYVLVLKNIIFNIYKFAIHCVVVYILYFKTTVNWNLVRIKLLHFYE